MKKLRKFTSFAFILNPPTQRLVTNQEVLFSHLLKKFVSLGLSNSMVEKSGLRSRGQTQGILQGNFFSLV